MRYQKHDKRFRSHLMKNTQKEFLEKFDASLYHQNMKMLSDHTKKKKRDL